MNSPLNAANAYAGALSPWANLTGTGTTTTPGTGGGLGGALGGGIAGAQLANLLWPGLFGGS